MLHSWLTPKAAVRDVGEHGHGSFASCDPTCGLLGETVLVAKSDGRTGVDPL